MCRQVAEPRQVSVQVLKVGLLIEHGSHGWNNSRKTLSDSSEDGIRHPCPTQQQLYVLILQIFLLGAAN